MMPSRAWPLWLLTASLLAAFPILNFVYWPQIGRSGALLPEEDSIGIPMFGSILLAVAITPIILGIAWLSLRHYNSETRIMAWRTDRPYRSFLATFVFGGLAACLVVGLLAEMTAAMPWYEYLWPVYAALWLPWLLGLRAAVIEQSAPR